MQLNSTTFWISASWEGESQKLEIKGLCSEGKDLIRTRVVTYFNLTDRYIYFQDPDKLPNFAGLQKSIVRVFTYNRENNSSRKPKHSLPPTEENALQIHSKEEL